MSTPDAQRQLNAPPEDGIGDRIRQAREKLGLSQVRLAEKTKELDRFEHKGIPRSVLIGYEAGRHKPGARELRLLGEALEVDIRHIVFGDEDVPEDILRTRASLHAGMSPDLPAALRIGFSLMRLKQHEREAFGSLILGMVNKTFKTEEAAAQLWDLAEFVALDQVRRLFPDDAYPVASSKVAQAIVTGQGLPELVAKLEPKYSLGGREAGTVEPKLPKRSQKSD